MSTLLVVLTISHLPSSSMVNPSIKWLSWISDTIAPVCNISCSGRAILFMKPHGSLCPTSRIVKTWSNLWKTPSMTSSTPVVKLLTCVLGKHSSTSWNPWWRPSLLYRFGVYPSRPLRFPPNVTPLTLHLSIIYPIISLRVTRKCNFPNFCPIEANKVSTESSWSVKDRSGWKWRFSASFLTTTQGYFKKVERSSWYTLLIFKAFLWLGGWRSTKGDVAWRPCKREVKILPNEYGVLVKVQVWWLKLRATMKKFSEIETSRIYNAK